MTEYENFAALYDTFMDSTPYEAWGDRILLLMEKYGIAKPGSQEETGIVCDLGCGTGKMTEFLASHGYNMIGVDLSEEMLEVARDRMETTGQDILYLNQDMKELDLYGGVGTFVSVCDCVNYLLTPEDLTAMFQRVHTFLLPGGLFIFDFNTLHKYRDVIGEQTIAENRETASFIWQNEFYEEISEEEAQDLGYDQALSHINVYDVTFFVADPEEGESREETDHFRRFTETHLQRGYTLKEMTDAAAAAGLRFVTAVDAEHDGNPGEDAERIVLVLKKEG